MTVSNTPSIHDEATQELLLLIAKMLVNDSNAVELDCFEENGSMMFNLRVAPADIGKVIGKQGQTVRSLRTILSASGMKLNRHYCLKIEDEWPE